MVAAHGARAAGGDTDIKKVAVAGENGGDDGDQDAEGAPGCAGGKGQHAGDEEDDGGEHVVKPLRRGIHQIMHVTGCVKRVERGLEGDSERENDDGGDHRLEALGNAAHGRTEADDAAGDKVDDREHQCDETAPGESDKGVGIAECADEIAGKVGAAGGVGAEEAANIEHADGAEDDEENDGDDKVNDAALGVDALLGAVGAAGEVTRVAGALFKATHRAVVKLEQCERDEKDKGQKGIEIIRNGADEELDTGNAGVEILSRRGYGGRPGRDRRDHAHGGGSGVDEVGELGTRDLVAVGDRTHDRANGQAVEIVIDEDENAEHERRKLRAYVGVDILLRPTAEGCAAAR